MQSFLIVVVATVVAIVLLNRLRYGMLKSRIFHRRRWGFNICCGKTDGVGINADIASTNSASLLDADDRPQAIAGRGSAPGYIAPGRLTPTHASAIDKPAI